MGYKLQPGPTLVRKPAIVAKQFAVPPFAVGAARPRVCRQPSVHICACPNTLVSFAHMAAITPSVLENQKGEAFLGCGCLLVCVPSFW